jgi:hypothetical protein
MSAVREPGSPAISDLQREPVIACVMVLRQRRGPLQPCCGVMVISAREASDTVASGASSHGSDDLASNGPPASGSGRKLTYPR